MADDTQNAATQISSGASQILSAAWSEFAVATASWRGIIGLALVLSFILVWSAKWPTKVDPPKADNTEVLSAVSTLRKDIAALRAQLTATAGEIGEQLDNLKTIPVLPIAKPKAKKQPTVAIAP